MRHSPIRRRYLLAAVCSAGLALAPSAWAAERTPSPAGARAYFVGLKDGDVVKSPLTLHFGLSGMGVAPAGIVMENTGHHHLFIDTPLPADPSQPVPALEGKVIHYGKGQTEATITLAPGKHTLQLELADARHIAHDPTVASEVVSITVLP
jgi:hypothetical protein